MYIYMMTIEFHTFECKVILVNFIFLVVIKPRSFRGGGHQKGVKIQEKLTGWFVKSNRSHNLFETSKKHHLHSKLVKQHFSKNISDQICCIYMYIPMNYYMLIVLLLIKCVLFRSFDQKLLQNRLKITRALKLLFGEL